MIDATHPSILLTTTSNFLGSSISDCPSTSDTINILEEAVPTQQHIKIQLNNELSIMYCGTSDVWNRANIAIDDSFICMIVEHLSCKKDDPEPNTIEETMHRSDWLK